MILYGRNLSPFVRRVAIWCALQGRTVESRPLAATEAADAEAIRKVHPGLRVPALELGDGTILIETFAITDWLDETADAANGTRLLPTSGAARRDCLQRIGIASATAEKAVALVYEKNRRPEAYHYPDWQARLISQIQGGLDAMEASVRETEFFGGQSPDGSDIATLCALQFVEVTNAFVLNEGYPRLRAHAARCMDLPAIAATHPSA